MHDSPPHSTRLCLACLSLSVQKGIIYPHNYLEIWNNIQLNLGRLLFESLSYRRVNLRGNPKQIDTKGFLTDFGSFDHA